MGFEASSVVGRRSSASQGLTPRPLRRGLTLVELLVVIVLVSTLVSTAIPIISPGGEGRKLREASRNINAYFQGAQARAIETGRPFGVAMRRLSEETGRGDDNAVVTRLEYVEVPAPYSGFDTSSLARLCVGTATTGQRGVRQLALQLIRYGSAVEPNEDRLPAGYDVDLVPDRFLRPGDQVEVAGARYVLILPTIETLTLFSPGPLQLAGTHDAKSVAAGFFNTSEQNRQYIFALRPAEVTEQPGVPNNEISLTPGGDLRATHTWQGVELPSPEAMASLDGLSYICTEPAPFKIYRQPIPAGGEPLELPNGIAVDLQSSTFLDTNTTRLYQPSRSAVYDDNEDEFRPLDEPAMVLFSPEGNVERVYLSDRRGATVSSRVTDTMALCVGRRELIPPQPTERLIDDGTDVPGTNVPRRYDEPIDLLTDLNELPENEQTEITDQYNWLNLESRWVVIGAQSGSIRTVETSSAFPSADTRTFAGQLRAALDGVKSGTKAGGL